MLDPLVTLTVLITLAVPTGWFPKFTLLADSDRFTTPAPLSGTVWGLVDAESTIVIVPDRVPIAVGVNETFIVHDFPAASLEPQPTGCTTTKSPLAEML